MPAWTRIWGPAKEALRGVPGVFATDAVQGNIYKRTGGGVQDWVKVGGPGRKFVIGGGQLYGLAPDASGVKRYSGVPGRWEQVGGPAADIFGGGAGLFATNPQTGGLYGYRIFYGNLYRDGWTRVGDRAKAYAVGGAFGEFAAATSYLYRITLDGQAVEQLDFQAMQWRKIGGAAASIYAGGDRLYATNPATGDIYEYVHVDRKWLRIGSAARALAVDNATGALYGLTPDAQAVRTHTGAPASWPAVGGPASAIFAGFFGGLYAINPQTHDLWMLDTDGKVNPYSKALDLVWSSIDRNGFPVNPRWAWQARRKYGDADYYPDVGGYLRPPEPWTDQIASTDSHWTCTSNAHRNWIGATFDGYIRWSSHSAPGTDDDYNLYLFADKGAGSVQRTDNIGGIQVEFDSDETVDHFKSPWWDAFHNAVDAGDAQARAKVDEKYAIVTALFGLDLQHAGQSELHPAWAVAIRAEDANPHDERWAIFVRTWGNEGWCSTKQHWMNLPTAPNGWKVYKLKLPWRPGATAVAHNYTDFRGRTDFGIVVKGIPNQGVMVDFLFHENRADEDEWPRINGTLRLNWSGPAGPYPVIADAFENVQVATGHKSASAHAMTIANLVAALPADEREAVVDEILAIRRPMREADRENRPSAQDLRTQVPPDGDGAGVGSESMEDARKAHKSELLRETLRRHGVDVSTPIQ